MKILKKCLLLIFICVMCLVLVSCFGKSGSDNPDPAPVPSPPATGKPILKFVSCTPKTDVALDGTLTMTFSESIKSPFNTEWITGAPLSDFTVNGTSVTCKLSNAKPKTQYHVVIKGGKDAIRSTSGDYMNVESGFDFTTASGGGPTPPKKLLHYIIVKIVNNTGLTSDQVFVAPPTSPAGGLELTNPLNTDTNGLVSGGVLMSSISFKTLQENDEKDGSETLIGSNVAYIYLPPGMPSGRIYFSMYAGLKDCIHKGTQDNVDWKSKVCKGQGAIMQDKIEFTTNPAPTYGSNFDIQYVDFFGLPIQISGSDNGKPFKYGVKDGSSFATIIANYKKLSSWQSLLSKNSSGDIIRIMNVGPLGAMFKEKDYPGPWKYAQTQLNKYFTSGKTITLMMPDGAGIKSGVYTSESIQNNTITFKGIGSYTRPKSGFDISIKFFGEAPDGDSDLVVTQLDNAIFRGVADLSGAEQIKIGNFYKPNTGYSEYGKFLCDHSIGGIAYVYANADRFNSFVPDATINDKSVITVTLLPLK